MIPRKSNSLGMEFTYNVAGTHEEYNALAKRPTVDACLEDAVEHVVQHDMNGQFREIFLHGREADTTNNVSAITDCVESRSGIKRKTKEVEKTKKSGEKYTVTEWDESEAEFFKRVLAERSEKAEVYADLAQSAADACVFDPSAAERQPKKPKTIPKAFIDKVTALHANGTVEKALKVIKRDLGDVDGAYTPTGDKAKDDETLARLVQKHAEWVALNKQGF